MSPLFLLNTVPCIALQCIVAENAFALLHFLPQNDALQRPGMHNHWLYYIRYAGAFFAIGGSVLLLAFAVKAGFCFFTSYQLPHWVGRSVVSISCHCLQRPPTCWRCQGRLL